MMSKLRSAILVASLSFGILVAALGTPLFWLWAVSQIATRPGLSPGLAVIFIVAVLLTWTLLTWGLSALNNWERRRRALLMPHWRYEWLRSSIDEWRVPVSYVESAAILAAFLV